MPPRTGPRSKRRPKAGAPRHFAVIRGEASTGGIVTELVIAHSLELDDHDLVFRDASGAISQVFAHNGWLQVRPTTMADMSEVTRGGLPAPPTESPAVSPAYSGTDAPLVVEFDPGRAQDSAIGSQGAPIREEAARPGAPERSEGGFVPSSPEEAQRILMELERRLKPNYQDPPDAPSPPRKD